MRAVNLIPLEDRRGAGAPGRSGGAVYGVLGALALGVLMVAALVLTSHSVKSKHDQLAQVTQQAQAAESQAGSLQAYTQFSSLRAKRQQTVASLAASRFDWAHSLHELARTLPAGTSLTSLRGTISPSATVDGTSDPLRASLNQPALELTGCATSQAGTAEVVAAMRRMDGVQRVSLSSSETNAKEAPGSAGAAAGGGSGNSADCRGGSTKRPQFSMTVFYAAPAPAAGSTGTGAAATASATTASTTTPTTTTPTTGSTK
ncbi:MAG: hypothetical protein ACXVFN_20560 [Solirubrobacteraceae bacterium]